VRRVQIMFLCKGSPSTFYHWSWESLPHLGILKYSLVTSPSFKRLQKGLSHHFHEDDGDLTTQCCYSMYWYFGNFQQASWPRRPIDEELFGSQAPVRWALCRWKVEIFEAASSRASLTFFLRWIPPYVLESRGCSLRIQVSAIHCCEVITKIYRCSYLCSHVRYWLPITRRMYFWALADVLYTLVFIVYFGSTEILDSIWKCSIQI
jgi:hypothetical protein